ncbi:hypothetical protein BS78_K192200 [Paspalum vaginatum]|uniref:Transposase (putative) gypsy type domain-containing protein n=1 Tax=Paspalum vaginatum TaxID=158149 RepID=A0A9W7XAT1_9POAL|nr:hypothetical protein BS78_K192200 [Paspalum vaginatum]
MSCISESHLNHLVRMGVLPPKELGGWRDCEGLPLCSFARGLLNFYCIDLSQLNPNSILQISIFIHLCRAFLGITPHFGLWKYLYHCKPGTRDKILQVVGGASLELRRGRKLVYLDIPLKDSNRGWPSEWFYMTNHANSLPARSGRQPNSKLGSWEEAPTTEEMAEVEILLNDISDLKDNGLTAHAIIIDFIFQNIQPTKDRVYPAYLYVGANDPTREIRPSKKSRLQEMTDNSKGSSLGGIDWSSLVDEEEEEEEIRLQRRQRRSKRAQEPEVTASPLTHLDMPVEEELDLSDMDPKPSAEQSTVPSERDVDPEKAPELESNEARAPELGTEVTEAPELGSDAAKAPELEALECMIEAPKIEAPERPIEGQLKSAEDHHDDTGARPLFNWQDALSNPEGKGTSGHQEHAMDEINPQPENEATTGNQTTNAENIPDISMPALSPQVEGPNINITNELNSFLQNWLDQVTQWLE